MLIAALGDTHGDLGWTNGSIRAAAAAGARLLLQVGDLGFGWPGPGRVRDWLKLDAWAGRCGVEMVWIRGNHDVAPVPGEPDGRGLLRQGEYIFHLPDGHRFTVDGVTVGGLGGATSWDREWRREEEWRKRKPRTLWWPEEPVQEAAAERLAAGGPVDLLLTHEVPTGVVVPYPHRETEAEPFEGYSQQVDRDRGLVARARAAVRPRTHVAGHHHIRATLPVPDGGVVEVLGRDGDREGALVLIDTTTWTVEPLHWRGS
ncbi:hypothetical protein GCM10023081_45720 [Arthrobacter ginkgonis]|uniref:Calcineurin-like phosphoesterase domain-containing protein n=1 Tax=Arthrobacter ginkgonis TaxID=1630594 RepID=A0ABP7DED1_9MICC